MLNVADNKTIDIKSQITNTRIEALNTLCWDCNILMYRVSSYGESTLFYYKPVE